MKLLCFTVLDGAVGAMLPPFFVRSKGEALRSFTEAVNDPQGKFNKYAVDFTLMSLGEWDDNSGVFVSGGPTRVIGGLEVLVTPEIAVPSSS